MNAQVDVAKITKFTGLRDSVYALALSADKSHFYSGSGDGFIVEWEPGKSQDGILIARLDRPVWALEYNEERTSLYAGNAAGVFFVIDLKQNKVIKEQMAHKNGIFFLKQSGEYLYSGGKDGTIKKWNSRWQLADEINLSDNSLRDCIFHPEKDLIAACGTDGLIWILNKEGKILNKLKGHDKTVFCMSFSTCGTRLFSGGRDAKLRIWDWENGNLTGSLDAHMYHIHSMALSPDGKLLATSSLDKTIRIWDSTSMELKKVIDKVKFDAHTNSVNKVLWIDSNHLISCSDDRTILITQFAE
jgi:WD40 repeat protein